MYCFAATWATDETRASSGQTTRSVVSRSMATSMTRSGGGVVTHTCGWPFTRSHRSRLTTRPKMMTASGATPRTVIGWAGVPDRFSTTPPAYVPGWTRRVSPGSSPLTPLARERKGAATVPGLPSAPVTATW